MNDKILGHKSYGSIPHMEGSRIGPGDHKCSDGQKRIATEKPRDKYDIIIIQEKLDGSNCAVAKIDNQLYPLGRKGYIANTSRFKMHHLFYNWVFKNYKRFNNLLMNGERIIGEWLVQAHGTRYNLPHEPYVVFDIMREPHIRLCYGEFIERIINYEFIFPRLISYHSSKSIEWVCKHLEPSGHGAIDPVEGAVWRVERENKVDFLVKYVRPDKIDGFYLDKEIYNNYPKKEADENV